MILDFSGGESFPNDGREDKKSSADKVLRAVVEVGQYVPGDVLLVPPIRALAAALDLNLATLYSVGAGGNYAEIIQHATGLTVMMHQGLVAYDPSVEVMPASEQIQYPIVTPEA